MPSRYSKVFSQLKASKQKAFIPFTLLGFPDRVRCLEDVAAMIDSGATALELGIAFSDPLADGPLIQQAATDVISSGFSTVDAFDLLQDIRGLNANIPIGLLVYYNTVLAAGCEEFFRQAGSAGVDGVLIVDLPPEAYGETALLARRFNVDSLFIISPLTTEKRLQSICEYASGFLYAVARLGLTGTEERYDAQLGSLLERAAKISDLPVCVGFGVSTPAVATAMFEAGADGVITGSRIIEIQKQGLRNEGRLATYLSQMISTAKFFAVASCCQ